MLVYTQPKMVQWVHYGIATNGTNIHFHAPLPNLTLWNNLLTCSFTWDSGATVSSVVTIDVNGNTLDTLTARIATWSSGNSQQYACYEKFGCTPGAIAFKITFSVSTANVNFIGGEFYNCATSSGGDGQANVTQVAGTSAFKSGNLTSVSDGDLIIQFTFEDNSQLWDGTSLTNDVNFNILTSDLSSGAAAQYAIQTTHGAINPTLTYNPAPTGGPGTGGAGASMTVAYKASAGAGTAPDFSLMRIQRVQMTNAPAAAVSTFPAQFSCEGNLCVVGFMGTAQSTTTDCSISSVSDTLSNTWVVKPAYIGLGSITKFTMQFAYSRLESKSNTLKISVNTNNAKSADNASNLDSGLILYDVVNPLMDSDCFDVEAGATGSTGNVSVDITPSVINGIIFAITNQDTGTVQQISNHSTTRITDNAYSEEYDGGFNELYRDGGAAHIYNGTNLNSVNIAWTGSAGYSPPGAWACAAIAFKPKLTTGQNPASQSQSGLYRRDRAKAIVNINGLV